MQITGQIQSVVPKKSGNSVKDGRNISWTIYEVMINGQKFSTFESAYQQMVGQTGTFDYETQTRVVNGRSYQNNTLASLNKKQGGSSASAARLDAMDKKLDEILSILKGGGQSFEAGLVPPDQQPTDDEIDVSDIPF